MLKNPCYVKGSKTGCPRRTAGCAVNCPDWAEYVEEREKCYKERKIKGGVDAAIYGIHETRKELRRKKYRR